MTLKCGMCKSYTGLGDWNLCCAESHDPAKFPLGHLCYADTSACEKFKPVDRISEKEFYEKYCMMCGSQRCEGIGSEWFDGCQHRYKLEGYTEKN